MAQRRPDYTAADHAQLILAALNGSSRRDPRHPDRDFLNNVIDYGGRANGAAMLNVMLLAGVTRLEIDAIQVRAGWTWESHRSTIRNEIFDGVEVIEERDGIFLYDRQVLEQIAGS